MEELAESLAHWAGREAFPFVAVVDDADFCAATPENFLWVAFTRSDPATDVYGVNAVTRARHWSCEAPLLVDARLKPFHDLVRSDDCFFAATGISGGDFLRGVRYSTKHAVTHSLVLRGKTGTLRYVESYHNMDRLSKISAVRY